MKKKKMKAPPKKNQAQGSRPTPNKMEGSRAEMPNGGPKKSGRY